MPFLGEILVENARRFPQRAAVISSGRTLSYGELDDASRRFAGALAGLGVQRGSRVAFLMKDNAEWLIAWYACQKLGAAAALLHSRLLPEELLRMMELSGASVLIYQADYADKAAYIAARDSRLRCCICAGGEPLPGHRSFGELLDAGPEAPEQAPLDGSEDCVILFTSGTTGVSKGIVRSQGMMDVYARVISCDGLSRIGEEVMLTPAPLYHAAGLCCVIKMARLAGTLVLVDSFCPDKICAQIERYRATQVALVPPRSYQRLKASGYASRHDLSSVRLVHITANKASRE